MRCENSLAIIKSVSFLKPETILNEKTKPIFAKFPENYAKTSEAEEEYRRLSSIKWSDFLGKNPYEMRPVEFWSAAIKHKSFKNIALYALSLLTLPLSNAIVERIFSIAGCVKSKQRNKMLLAKLDAIVRIREYAYQMGICCDKFVATENMISKFDVSMYNRFQ